MHKRVVVFHTLTLFNLPIALILSRLGFPVDYLFGKFAKTGPYIDRLIKRNGIRPINMESTRFINVGNSFIDPHTSLDAVIEKVAPRRLLEGFSKYFAAVSDPEHKLRLLIHRWVAVPCYDAGRIRMWVESEYPECRSLWLWYSNLFGRELVQSANCKVVQLCPAGIDFLEKTVTELLDKGLSLFSVRLPGNSAPPGMAVLAGPGRKGGFNAVDNTNVEVLYFPHKGIGYANLFKKDYYYSGSPASPFHPTNMLHVHYGVEGDLSSLQTGGYSFATIDAGTRLTRMRRILKTIPAWKNVFFSWRHLMIAVVLSKTYASFRGYVDWLGRFPKARTAIIGYDILMPISILMALEARNIVSVAAQERMLLSWFDGVNVMLDTYFCASELVAKTLVRSPNNAIEHVFPLGMQRTDWLHAARTAKTRYHRQSTNAANKTIVALNYHSVEDEETNRLEPTINRRANRVFIEDMIRLASDVPDVHIIIRGKDDLWCRLPCFSDLMEIIDKAPNVEVNRQYDVDRASYVLCANADLVIAKYTSLGDECLAVGIPVLFHEYTHNSRGRQTASFAYPGLDIIAHDYATLKRRTEKLLSLSHAEYMELYGASLDRIYGKLGDGHVQERILAKLEELHASVPFHRNSMSN